MIVGRPWRERWFQRLPFGTKALHRLHLPPLPHPRGHPSCAGLPAAGETVDLARRFLSARRAWPRATGPCLRQSGRPCCARHGTDTASCRAPVTCGRSLDGGARGRRSVVCPSREVRALPSAGPFDADGEILVRFAGRVNPKSQGQSPERRGLVMPACIRDRARAAGSGGDDDLASENVRSCWKRHPGAFSHSLDPDPTFCRGGSTVPPWVYHPFLKEG